MQPAEIAALARRLKENIARVVVGKEDMIELMLAAVIARGHVLLEDVPGTGKTVTARSLAASIGGSFSRIQFTPDLLPADITGARVFRQDRGEFVFHPGPVFAHILLADEINRATPRTQSALLECMEERQVTDGGVTYPMPDPFLVIATENPVETQGTFPLPEAQLDRFFMKLSMGEPTQEEEVQILNRFMKMEPLKELSPVARGEEIVSAGAASREVYVHPQLVEYIASIAQESRQISGIISGVSPRGSIALLHAAQSYAYIDGLDYVVPEDIKAVAVPVLAHRLVLSHVGGQRNADKEAVARILGSVPVPTEKWER